ncbi:MAG: phospho-N-acetylmuramoyl-pentapeptide-transferase [Oscillospiraceae bacterium]|nr:phospho-N-acetylmuramoyl-pentapeptide-transferase [Oscillospiraceae bacterium]MBR3611164.1 phospho-N-acetylmuramoyl-pentapeptide-transferase [Oscillospiraceae bacterium]MBR3952206.1 phospho-N-acetylmuramoyl-pentapeptide-transferase [Oscillospiraceae bacterium]
MQIALIAFVAFAISALSGHWLIPALRKLNFGQSILEIGPSWHKNKEGTPTMGGIMFVIGILAASILAFFFLADAPATEKIKYGSGLIMALGYGLLGFIDDYTKVVRKQNEGLTAKQKLIGQVLLAVMFLAGLYLSGTLSTVLVIPFIGQLDIGFFYYPLAVFIIVGASNAVNLTDGIDGLCSSVTFVCACGFIVMSAILEHTSMSFMAAALAGGCAGYFLWNCYPARVFMGDTGSLFLGGMVCALAFGLNIPMILLFAGIVYVIETLSDIIQIGSYKIRKKRVFKMAPIHHHFEMSGWSEWKIVIVFCLVGLCGALISILAVTMI